MADSIFSVLDMSPGEREEAHRRFAAADPFPHAVFEDALRAAPSEIATAWPEEDWPGWSRFRDEHQRNKAYCNDITAIPPPLRELLHSLGSPEFLGWLETLTGIPKLLPDPYLSGGGLHMSGPGGVLTPHTDFHLNLQLDLFRRVNVLLYLNEEWEQDWGGCLELYGTPSAEQSSRVVVPRWGTMVVFQTDDKSIHGFPAPVADGRVRRSIATYYYTSSEAPRYSGDTTTYWRHNKADGGPVRRARALAYRGLIFVSRSIAFVAHRLNPKL
jgi:hypothetical protein